MSSKNYQLNEKLQGEGTTFFDPETKLKVVRNQVVSIDVNQRKGKLTLAAIDAGGLIETNRQPSKSFAGSKSDDSSDLPQDFPSRDALIAGGYDSLAKVKAASDDELHAVKGIGNASLEKIRAAVQ